MHKNKLNAATENTEIRNKVVRTGLNFPTIIPAAAFGMINRR